MISSSASTTLEINAAIESHNPFVERGAAVRAQDVWDKGLPDVSSLNAHASDAVFQAIQQVNSAEGKVTSIAIVGQQGTGKTHIISRIRQRLLEEGNNLFIYASASHFTDLKLINYHFLQILSQSLNQTGNQNLKQWQELAIAILIEAYNHVGKHDQAEKISQYPQDLIQNNFPAAIERNHKFIDSLVSVSLLIKPNVDPDIIRAILWTLSEVHAPYAIKWLSGDSLSGDKATELSLPNNLQEYQEAKAFEFALQILGLISDYKPLLICFDELEGVSIDDSSSHKAQAIAELVKNLFDSLISSSRHGIVILTAMLPDTWKLKIKSLPGGIPHRVSAATTEAIELKYLNADSIVELVSLWLQEFYNNQNLVPETPVYPFTENQLRELGNYKPTTREVITWCANNFVVPTIETPTPEVNSVQVAFDQELATVEASIETLIEDKSKLAAALLLSFSHLIGKTINDVTIERIEKVEPVNLNKGFIDFKVIANQNEETLKIGVAILQQDNSNQVLAGLKRLIEYKTFDLNRGCLLRSKDIGADSTQLQEGLKKLLSPKLGGKWVILEAEAIKPLLAILFVSKARENYDLSKEQVNEFIEQSNLVVNNSLIHQIISKS